MMYTAHVLAHVVRVYMSYERRLGWVVIRFFRYSKVKVERIGRVEKSYGYWVGD